MALFVHYRLVTSKADDTEQSEINTLESKSNSRIVSLHLVCSMSLENDGNIMPVFQHKECEHVCEERASDVKHRIVND